jgi:hypothetical protein
MQENGAMLRSGAAETVKELARACDLYLVTQCLDDTSEIAVMSALESAGLFVQGMVNRDKVSVRLLCLSVFHCLLWRFFWHGQGNHTLLLMLLTYLISSVSVK